MPSLAEFATRREHAAIASIFFLAPFLTLVAPLTTVVALILLAAISIGVALLHGESPKALLRFGRSLALFALVGLYLLINATWSADFPNALSKTAWFTAVALLSFASARALAAWNERQLKVAASAFLIGIAIGIAFVLFELISAQAIMRFVYNTFPGMRPGPKTVTVHHGHVVKIIAFELNHNVAVMLLLLWPALLCLTRLFSPKRRAVPMIGLFAAVALAIALSEHQTSQVGIVVSALVFLFASYWPAPTRRGVALAWCLAFLLIIPIALLAYQSGLHEAGWLPHSARERITLWAYTSEKIAENPLLGIGLTSTRKLNAKKAVDSDQTILPDTADPRYSGLKWSTGPHAHNEFLQTWYELGALGVILFAVAGLTLLSSIRGLPRPVQPFMLAQFAAFVVTASFAWGMWQSWLMALSGLSAIYAVFAARYAPEGLQSGAQVAAEFGAAANQELAQSKRPA